MLRLHITDFVQKPQKAHLFAAHGSDWARSDSFRLLVVTSARPKRVYYALFFLPLAGFRGNLQV